MYPVCFDTYWMQFVSLKLKRLAMIRNCYNQIPYPALKTKREITKYINWQQFTKGTRGKASLLSKTRDCTVRWFQIPPVRTNQISNNVSFTFQHHLTDKLANVVPCSLNIKRSQRRRHTGPFKFVFWWSHRKGTWETYICTLSLSICIRHPKWEPVLIYKIPTKDSALRQDK